jgi:hypothetical protein
MTRDEALAILASGDFEQFRGVAEGLEVEFKAEPYRLIDEAQKFELAKDVSALANAAGGVIVIGVRTERNDQAAVDVAAELRLLEAGLMDEQQYSAIASERVYPRMRELSVRFYASAADANRGLGAIDVPPQAESDRYFLIQRPLAGGQQTRGWLIGITIRSVGRVEERRVGEIHTLINRGLGVGRQLGDVVQGLAELREAVQGGTAVAPETPADRLDAVLEQRVGENPHA